MTGWCNNRCVRQHKKYMIHLFEFSKPAVLEVCWHLGQRLTLTDVSIWCHVITVALSQIFINSNKFHNYAQEEIKCTRKFMLLFSTNFCPIDFSLRIKIGITFIFRFHRRPILLVVFFSVGLLSICWHLLQVFLGVEISSVVNNRVGSNSYEKVKTFIKALHGQIKILFRRK